MPSVRLALLACDIPPPPIQSAQGSYTQIFQQYLSSSLAPINASKSDDSKLSFTLDGYDVMTPAMAYPSDEDEYDGLLISGSRHSAYEDVDWINKLAAYLERIVREKPRMKIFGICFGHQIIARALGGKCEQNGVGWEVSVTTVQLSDLGKAIFGSDQLDLQQMHRDHVPTDILPSNAHLLGNTSATPNQGMVIFDSPSGPPADLTHVPLTSIHVLTLQGHPEFTKPIVDVLLDGRVILLGEEMVEDGRRRAGGIPGRAGCHPDGLACDGVGRVGKVVWGMLGVE